MNGTIIMKPNVYNYTIVQQNEYDKTCLKCGRKFTTHSKNKRLCNNCALAVNNEKNNARVKKYNRKYGNSSTIGTGRLKGKRAKNNFEEMNYIIDEMKYLRLI